MEKLQESWGKNGYSYCKTINETHFILIKAFYQFMYQFMYQTKHKEKKHFCMYCLQQFSSLEVLNKHKTNCMVVNGKQAIEMPKKGKKYLKVCRF